MGALCLFSVGCVTTGGGKPDDIVTKMGVLPLVYRGFADDTSERELLEIEIVRDNVAKYNEELNEYHNTLIVVVDSGDVIDVNFIDMAAGTTAIEAKPVASSKDPNGKNLVGSCASGKCSVDIEEFSPTCAKPLHYVAFHGHSTRSGNKYIQADPLVIIVPKDSACS